MSCFDASTAHYDEDSPTMKTYRSYMCTSRDSYILPGRGKDLKVNEFHYPWNTSREKFVEMGEFDSKPPHISKLRNILSETISNITKDINLRSGESVELTLEIELVKDPLTSPTNSLVEVTIMQHKPEEYNLTKIDSGKHLENGKKFQAVTTSFSSECPSQKRRNWFERVIKRYYYKSPKSNSSEELYKKSLINNRRTQLHPITDKNITNIHKSKFINVLPKAITTRSIDYSTGYRRVSPRNKTFKDSSPGRTQPLIKKISKIFLPTEKLNKNKAIKSVLSDLKKEVDHMELIAVKGRTKNKKRKIPPVPKLGKIVSNILADVMENCNVSDSNDKDSFPIHYQSFYEPVVRNNTKKEPKNSNTSNKVSGLSRSDTCIGTSMSGPVVKSSRSVNDCNQLISFSRKRMTQCQGIGDSRQTSTKNKIKYGKKGSIHCWEKDEKGDGKRHKSHKVNSKQRLRKHKKNKALNKKYSAIKWNGRTYEVNKEVKFRIEKIIVNELQNLALKEGMECNVSPLPSSDNSVDSFKAVEKISSFICELDISDKQFNKVRPQKQKILKANASYIIERKRSSKVLKRNSKKIERSNQKKVDQREKAESIPYAQSSPEQASENDFKLATTELSTSKSVSECHTKSSDCKKSPVKTKNLGVKEDGFEIKYVNINSYKWSNDSVVPKCSEIKETNEPIPQHDKNEPKETSLNDLTLKHLSSGFVKRIESNDSTWNDVLIGEDVTTNQCRTNIKDPKQLEKEDSPSKATMVISATSNESEKNIQIELDLKDLETILNEAKQMQDSRKILINAKRKHGMKKNARSREFTGKNSTLYTDHLLMKAAQKLEKYRRSKLKL